MTCDPNFLSSFETTAAVGFTYVMNWCYFYADGGHDNEVVPLHGVPTLLERAYGMCLQC